MLRELFLTGITLTQVIGLCCLLWGVLLLVGAIFSGRGPFDFVKGGVLMAFGAYVVGLGQSLPR
ncbi:MAG: hypothetical protein KDJ44_16550 [Rhodoblastus sp.]|nr:hypothetical protein [Rhodoblastus sp.]